MMKIKYQPTLINEEFLRAYSLFPKNYDLTEIWNFVPIAEEIHVQSIIGVALFEELLEQVAKNEISDVNSTLLLEIYKVEGLATLYEALPFCWAHLTQVGLTLGKSDNSDSIQNKDIAYLNTHIKSQLEFQKNQLKKFMERYSDNFPLYDKDVYDDVTVTTKSIFAIPKENIDLD